MSTEVSKKIAMAVLTVPPDTHNGASCHCVGCVEGLADKIEKHIAPLLAQSAIDLAAARSTIADMQTTIDTLTEQHAAQIVEHDTLIRQRNAAISAQEAALQELLLIRNDAGAETVGSTAAE